MTETAAVPSSECWSATRDQGQCGTLLTRRPNSTGPHTEAVLAENQTPQQLAAYDVVSMSDARWRLDDEGTRDVAVCGTPQLLSCDVSSERRYTNVCLLYQRLACTA